MDYKSSEFFFFVFVKNTLKHQICVADVSGCGVDLYVSRFDARHEDSVTIHKLGESVSDGITSPSDPDGLHHAGVTKLTNTQLSVK